MTLDNKLITPKNRLIITIVSSIVLILLLLGVARLLMGDLIERIELKSFDWRAQLSTKNHKHTEDIVLLVVDDISLQNAVSHPELGLTRWPWPRDVHGNIVKYLQAAGAKAIIFDIIFEGKEGTAASNNESDMYFIKAVEKAKNVFFAVSLTYSKRGLEKYANKEQIKKTISSISSPILKKVIAKFSINPKVENLDETIKTNIEFFNMSNVLNGLLFNAKGIGSVTLPNSLDGITRTVRPVIILNGRYYPGLPLSVYLSLYPKSSLILREKEMLLNNKVIPLDEDGAHLINWYGPAGTIKHFRALDVILAQKSINQGHKNPLNYNVFKNKIVVIGLTAAATDILPTPMSGAYPGPEIVATVLSNYIDSQQFISKFPFWPTFILVTVFCLILGVIILCFRSGFAGILCSLLVLSSYVYLCVFCFTHKYIWIDLIFPSLAMLFTIMITFVSKYVTTRKAYEDTYQLATTDGLTGLFNHRYFQETLTISLQRAQRYNNELSLLLLDLDHFKKINDTHGHRAGDKVLKEVSARMKKTFRTTDIIARYGGEEIIVLLTNTSFDNALIAANKLLNAISSKEFDIEADKSIKVTASIGVANFPKHAQNAPELIELTDQGLYFAKENGRNRIGTIEQKLASENEELPVLTKQEELIDIPLKVDKSIYEKLQKCSNSRRKEDMANWLIRQIMEK